MQNWRVCPLRASLNRLNERHMGVRLRLLNTEIQYLCF